MARPDSVFRNDILKGCIAVVFGGTSGINRHIAKTFGLHGASVFVVSRDQVKVNDTLSEFRGLGIRTEGCTADVRDFSAVEKAIDECVERLGAIDIVISGAAGNFVAPASKLSANGFQTVVNIDLIGTFQVFRAAYPKLKKPGAALIAITATHAMKPAYGQAHVCAAKAGIQMLTQALALEWGGEGIRVNSLAPGPVDGTEGMARLTPDEASRASLCESIPLNRYATLDEIADLALFMVSDAARYITGTTMVCDGGQSLGGHTRYGA